MNKLDAEIRKVAEEFCEDVIRYMLAKGHSDREILEFLSPFWERWVKG